MSEPLHILPINDADGRKRFVRFAWQVYDKDPYWVPPLISSRLHTLDPARGPFYRQGEAALFMARRGDRDVGTIVAWINHRANQFKQERTAAFGYFEVLPDYEAAKALLDTACQWAREKGMTLIRGPLRFSPEDSPGVLIGPTDRPPVLLVGYSPPYYAEFLERYGFEKYRDAYAYAIDLLQFEGKVENIPPKILRAARVATKRYHVQPRPLRMDDWDNEVARAMEIFNEALGYQREHVPMDEAEFRRFADELRSIIVPELALFAEVEREPVGLCITLPDLHQVLRHLNGRLFPFGWLKFLWYRRKIDVASLKILGVREAYRARGVDALFYVEIARYLMAHGYRWLDLSLIAEENQTTNLLARRLGGEIYQTFRTYQLALA